MFPFNVRPIIYLLLLLCAACKIPYSAFKEENIDKNMLKDVPGLMKKTVKIKSIRVYKASLAEYLVERNGVEELKLLNTGVPNPELNEPAAGLSHHLYYLYFDTEPKSDIAMFLSTTYNVEGLNTRLGPGYLGFTRGKQFNASYQLKIIKSGNAYVLKAGKRFEGPTKIFFHTDEDLRNMSLEEFNMTKIVNQQANKIGSGKSLVYDIPVIFGDKNALLFIFDKTIKFN